MPTCACGSWEEKAALQEKLRALSAYSYGTEGGVENNTPNPWGMRLGILRAGLMVGLLVCRDQRRGLERRLALAAGRAAGHISWRNRYPGFRLGHVRLAGMAIHPQGCARTPHPGAAFASGHLPVAPAGTALAGWGADLVPIEQPWPAARAMGFPLPAGELAGLIAPLQLGEGSGLLDRAVWQDVPAPPPSQPLLEAGFKVGTSVATGEWVGVDPDGHGLATGGSRTGKSSFTYAMLKQLIARGDDAPGIFLVDPHLSLADAFLDLVAQLPEEERKKAVKRLRVITPDRPWVVPLNLLAVPDFTWAGNAIVQVGRRIWDDYWGPRMQAALLGLFRLAHVWNQAHPGDGLGLLHVVFLAFNREWRHKATGFLPPGERIGSLALDALLGQTGEDGKWSQGWVTEVISPVLSKVMALEMSPWLFSAMHQPGFVDMSSWAKETSLDRAAFAFR